MKALFRHFANHPWRVPLYALVSGIVFGGGQFMLFMMFLNYDVNQGLAIAFCVVGAVVLSVMFAGYITAVRALSQDKTKRAEMALMLLLTLLHLAGTLLFWGVFFLFCG